MLSSGLFFNGFGFYFEPIRSQFGWSRTAMSGAISLSRLESGILGPIEGYLIQRFEPRKVMFVGFLIFALGFSDTELRESHRRLLRGGSDNGAGVGSGGICGGGGGHQQLVPAKQNQGFSAFRCWDWDLAASYFLHCCVADLRVWLGDCGYHIGNHPTGSGAADFSDSSIQSGALRLIAGWGRAGERGCIINGE